MDKCRADVTICGADYVLSGEKSEDKIKEIAKFVDDELRRTSRALNSNPNYKCAVLTAINIAEKLMEKKQVTDLKEQMNDDSDRQIQDSEKYKNLQAKCTEMENAYFDLQMENVNLKNELRSLKKFREEDEQ